MLNMQYMFFNLFLSFFLFYVIVNLLMCSYAILYYAREQLEWNLDDNDFILSIFTLLTFWTAKYTHVSMYCMTKMIIERY